MTKIGIDVGGTNTDALVLDGAAVVAAAKTATTADVTGGIAKALRLVLAQPGVERGAIEAVIIGTTHFTNAVIARQGLRPVAAVRICLPASAAIPPFADWPGDLRAVAGAGHHLLAGGHEYDGRPIAAFDAHGMHRVAREIAAAGVEAVAISAVFSPLDPRCEEAAGAILREHAPGLDVTLSHRLGRLGLMERENVAILNSSLMALARRTTRAFVAALRDSGIAAPLYLTQNDGTIMSETYAAGFPVYSFASGPTNSMRGAAFLSRIADAIVVDVGGTTTDVGCLRRGFPHEANNIVHVGGVRTNFRMPDVLSIGLGGGSIVDAATGAVGPRSVGFELTRRARVFGGDVLTATDVAVAAGLVELGDRSRVADLDSGLVRATVAAMHAMVADAVDRMKLDAAPTPLIAVGGGAFLIPPSIPGISEVITVPHGAVANAVGAAIAQVSGEVDRIFRGLPREEAIARARAEAVEQAIRSGAEPASITVVDVEDLPLAYLAGNTLRTRVRVVGDIAGAAGA
ncbi:MAG: hydantoinase/oxoprolinase family protein [Alphaproteobacteria bacterium]|nr:hydantoinase/oxoprolinase family protein [Alphaproteobacteria bacterium]